MTQAHVPEAGRWVTHCNTKGCAHKITSPRWSGGHKEMFQSQKSHRANLAVLGWRCFVSNTRRYYCPDHGPKLPLGRNTREVTP